jgi:hypothetical protein
LKNTKSIFSYKNKLNDKFYSKNVIENKENRNLKLKTVKKWLKVGGLCAAGLVIDHAKGFAR